MSSFSIRSSAGGLVSLLNDEDVPPRPIAGPPSLSSPTRSDIELSELAKPLATRKHRCTLCNKAFTTSGHLTRHGKIHSGERSFECPSPHCIKRTARLDNLTQHYRMHLPKPLRKECHSFVRARLDEMQVRTQMQHDGPGRWSTSSAAEYPAEIAQHSGSDVRQWHKTDPPPFARRRADVTRQASQDQGELTPSPTLTYGSERSSILFPPSQYTTTPTSSYGADCHLGLIDIRPTPKDDVNYIDYTSPTSGRSHQGYAISYVRGE